MTKERRYRIMISGGGTGGHIFPAVAIARQLQNEGLVEDILFVGAEGKMEMTRVPDAGYKIEGLWISGLQRKLTFKNLLFPFKLIHSVVKARRIINRFRPDIVIGTGGYASGPTVIAANRKGIPVVLQEQNSYPGLTNRKLSRHALKVCVAYEGMEKYFEPSKVVLTGNPVRDDITASRELREQGLAHFGLKKDKVTILVIGGSLGARTLNESIVAGIDQLYAAGLQVLWQTGKLYYDEMLRRAPHAAEKGVSIQQFIDRMDLAYACADIVISRAGALSISELCIAGLPVVFVPSPNVAADHQRKNAQALVEKEAALMVDDKDAATTLVDTVIALSAKTDEKEKIAKNIKALAKPNATKDIVEQIKIILN